jgi:hypothetical protein
MNRRVRVIGSAAAAAIVLLGATGNAYADTTFDTGMVTVVSQTRALRVGVGDIAVVSVNKVSNPGVQVRVTADDGSQPVMGTTHAAGENGCGAADDPIAGTLNRTVTVQGGASATVYVKVQYTTTTPMGVSTTTVLEPLGPAGITVDGAALVVGVPVDVCVA